MVQTPNCNLLLQSWTISLDGVEKFSFTQAPGGNIVSKPYFYIESCDTNNIVGKIALVSYAITAGG